jgi:hypothetical protein
MRNALIALVLLGCVAGAQAGYIYDVKITDPYGGFSGGPFDVENFGIDLPGADNFVTFCAEKAETFHPGQRYWAQINTQTELTGKVLRNGAAWLYSEFRHGTLVGANNNVFDLNDGQDQEDLQNALWKIMGFNVNVDNNDFYDAAIARDYNGEDWDETGEIGNVRILNLKYGPNGSRPEGTKAQDQFIIIPIPGAVALGALGLGALIAIKRR